MVYNTLTKEQKKDIASMKKEIEKAKKKLRGKDICENFGQNDVRRIKDKYFHLSFEEARMEYFRIIDAFDEWCMTYC